MEAIDVLHEIIDDTIGAPDSIKGDEFNYPCPFCEKAGYAPYSSHLHINYFKNCCICHQCEYGQRDVKWVVRDLLGKIPRTLMRARLAKGISAYVKKKLDFKSQQTVEADEDTIVESELPPYFVPLTGRPKNRIGRIVLDYLIQDRKLTYEIVTESGVGYCPDGYWKGYAIFPVYVGGHLVTWTSRRVVALGSKVQHDPSSKSSMALFNYDVCLEGGYKRVFVGEGPFDAWSFHTVGTVNGGVGLLGKKLHPQQIKLLRALPCDELCVCLDDTEHERSIEYAYKLKKNCPNKRVTTLLLAEGDPNENIRKLGRLIRGRQDVGLSSRVRSKLVGILR